MKRTRHELIIDNFAGGGGASTGIELALCRSPDAAINHDPEALAMHRANHPRTRHYATDVFDIDPRVVCRNQPVGLAWFSPDCTHHSKARGGKPMRDSGKKSRSLAWVVTRWAEQVRPRVIILENVEEFQDWGPVVPKVGQDGEPVFDAAGRPWYVPCPKRRGKTFKTWKRKLERLGYAVELRELRACDYGAPTVRKRLFVIARRDGRKIVWPEPTHGKPGSPDVLSGKRLPWRTAAEIIDWSLPCPSIFLTQEEARALKLNVKRPLKPATMKRIAAGLKRYVLDAAEPFIVRCAHGDGRWGNNDHSLADALPTVTGSKEFALVTPYVQTYHCQKGDEARGQQMGEPLRTQDTENRFSVVAPYLVSPAHSTTTGRGPNHWPAEQPLTTVTSSNDKYVVAPVLTREFGNSAGADPQSPAPTIMPGGGGKTALVAAFLAQHNGGMVGHQAERPLSTITLRGTQQQVVAASIVGCGGRAGQSPPTAVDRPLGTITGKADKCLAASFLSHQRTSNTGGGNGDLEEPLNCLTSGGNHVAHVMAFLQKYYSCGGQDANCRDPMHTLTAKARMGLVTIDSIDWQIVDIGMRMLTPRELFRAQGFPTDYLIAPVVDGRPLPKSSQVRMCGNSVCPPLAEALVRANCSDLAARPAKRQRQLELAGV